MENRGFEIHPVVILKLGLRNISKRITGLIFLNIYTAPEHALAHIILLVLKIIDKANSKSDLKIKEALHINLKKPNLNAQKNHLALTHFTIRSVAPCFFLSLFVFLMLLSFISLSSTIFIFFDANCWHLSLSYYTLLLLHLVTTHLISHILFHLLCSLSLRQLSASFTVLITLRYYFIFI